MTENIFKNKKRKSLLGQAVLILTGIQLLFLAAFVTVELPTATQDNIANYLQTLSCQFYHSLPTDWAHQLKHYFAGIDREPGLVRYSSYCFLAPTAVFLGYVCGPVIALVSSLSFLVLGFLGPYLGIFPLSAGGGLGYYKEPGFGYLIGFVFAAWLSGIISANRRTSVSQLLAIAASLVTLHITGIAYLFAAYLAIYLVEGSKELLAWQPWIFEYIRNLSWYSLPYDMVFSILLVGLGFPFRWLNTTLLTTEVNSRVRGVKDSIRELDERPVLSGPRPNLSSRSRPVSITSMTVTPITSAASMSRSAQNQDQVPPRGY